MINYEKFLGSGNNKESVESFLLDTLIPDLFEWVEYKKYDFSLVKFFHSKGLSFNYIQSLSEKFPPLKNALSLAVESTKRKILDSNVDVRRSLQYIKFLDSLCNSNSNSLPDSVIVFRPADSLLEQKYKNSIS